MSATLQEVGVTADLTVDVPRDAAGDLPAGVRTVLARADGVESVESVSVDGLQPRLNDLRAEVTAEVRLAVERLDEPAVRAALADGFGVAVESVELDDPPP